jgi:neutral ceramidase
MPVEATTMSGRRLRETVMAELGDWARHIVLAGYSNGYAGYVTTQQEYMLQQYEAAHTLHGRWSLAAYRQVASQLASALESGSAVESSLSYDDWRGNTAELPLPVVATGPPPSGVNYGDALPLDKTQYRRGETVTAEFWSSSPSAAYRTDNNFLLVEYKTSAGWQPIASDGDWNTRIRWRVEDDGLLAQLSWQIPADSQAGEYRLTHIGQGNGGEFRGVSLITLEPEQPDGQR